jgi:quercetin dioxygenase-like cupin family protein
MKFPVRRIVTGHDENGRAIVKIDNVMSNTRSLRPGHASHVVWSEPLEVDNDRDADGSQGKFSRVLENGTVFRIIRLEPNVQGALHRTNSLDYAVVVHGECDMELDDGREVHLQAGDVLVQRGTTHSFLNRSNDICLIAIVLISAKPATAGGKVLPAID